MFTTTLGRTNIDVSVLSMGTVALGINYGIKMNEGFDRPSIPDAISLLETARNCGINFYDTAPTYGDSEKLLGNTFNGDTNCYIATKISTSFARVIDKSECMSQKKIIDSIKKSVKLLRRQFLDVLQLHNATVENFDDQVLLDTLHRCKNEGLVNHIGATIYNEQDAIAAIDSEIVDVLQIPFSILDQRLLGNVLPLAKSAKIGIVARSVLLKGVLSSRSCYLPSHLDKLREASARIKSYYDVSWEELTQIAIRFCLGISEIDTVLLGITTPNELDIAIEAVNAGNLSDADINAASNFQIEDNTLLNPAFW